MGMKKRSSGGGANWMDTYGDMVTLLMCFFVLLYSMSTMDQQKIIQLVQAFNPSALTENPPNIGNPGNVENVPGGLTESDVNKALDQLYSSLEDYIAENGAPSQSAQSSDSGMSVTKGEGFVFIALNDAVFFDGDSYKLLPAGKEALDAVSAMLETQKDYIDELRVLGHTAQERFDRPNDYGVDRMLAAQRSAVVTSYLQEKRFLDPARLVAMSYGQWRPIATNDNRQGQAQNRRVEIIVSGLNVAEPGENTVAKYYTDRGTDNPYPDGSATKPPAETTPGTVETTPGTVETTPGAAETTPGTAGADPG